jgi:hypothetical protein
MRAEGIRQSDRITLRLQVEASWFGTNGMAVRQPAHTMLVSRNGGVLRLQDKLFAGQEITLHRKLEGDQARSTRARIVAEIDREPEGFIYAVAMLEPRADFWDIEFPAPQQAEEALARLLMECSFCQRREVVYLNEMELKSFEIRKCVARLCRHCDAPAIWVEAATEPKIDGTLPSRTAAEERVIPRRNRTRVKARLLNQFPEQEPLPGRDAAGSGGAVHPGSGSDLCAHPNCVFAAHRHGGVVPPWRGIRKAAGVAGRSLKLSEIRYQLSVCS